jgi:hypothetical protein
MFSSLLLLAASVAAGPAVPPAPTAAGVGAPLPTTASVGYVAGANPKAYRLTGDVVPTSYKIAFNVAPASGVYSASEQITVKLAKPAGEIVIHSVDMEITYHLRGVCRLGRDRRPCQGGAAPRERNGFAGVARSGPCRSRRVDARLPRQAPRRSRPRTARPTPSRTSSRPTRAAPSRASTSRPTRPRTTSA